jgi:hypothetical protein
VLIYRYLLSNWEDAELLDPLNAPGKAVKLYIPAISYTSICKGPLGSIQAERKLVKVEYTTSELSRSCPRLNIRKVAE